MNIKNKYQQGTTLIEMITSIVVISIFFTLSFMVYNFIHIEHLREIARTEINNYANRTMDELDEYITHSVDGVSAVGIYDGFPRYRLTIIKKDSDGVPILYNNEYIEEDIEIKCDGNTGILINGNVSDRFFSDNRFIATDNNDLTFLENTSLIIKDFKIENSNPNSSSNSSPGISLPPSIANNVKESSYLITFELEVEYDNGIFNKKTQTRTFERKVFSPNAFVNGNQNV